MNVTFFDLLGIDPNAADRAGAAKTLLSSLLGNSGLISLTQGINLSDDSVTMIGMLQQGLVFANVRPGVDPHAALGSGPEGQIGFAADMAVQGPLLTQQPFYLRAMPDHGIQLAPTDPLHPAHIFFVADGRGQGRELIIDSLPVKLLLKTQLASVLSGSPAPVGSFDPANLDSFAYTLGDDTTPAEIDCFVRIQLTPEGDIIFEPSVPVSLGPVRWMGLPATAVYDIQFLPSPNRRDYLEWTHNDVGSFASNPPAAGALGFRSIDVDFSQAPFSDLKSRVQTGAMHLDNLELVLEDIVVPVAVPILPIPSHGTVGFRRKITDRTDIQQAYSLSGAPVQIPMYGSPQQAGNGGSSLTLQVEEFFFQTGDIHAIDPADQPQVQFQAELIFGTATGKKLGPTMGIDAEWTFTAGMVLDIGTTPLKMTIADTTIGLVGFKFGVSVGRLCKGLPFKDSFELLGDLYLTSTPTGLDTSLFKMRSLTGKPLSLVVHDLGWKLGHFSVDGLQFPDGMQLIFANTVRIIIEEMGWVEEPNGTPYFSFSGGIAIGFGGGNAVKPQGNSPDDQANGFGIRVRRLRFRLNDDDSQPAFKLDGVFLKLKYAIVDIEGFGYISDYTDSGWGVREWGFGVKVVLNVIVMTFSLAAEFIKGNRRNLSDTSQNFDYFLASLSLSFLPAGAIGLYDLRALVADNMAPNLDATFPDGEGMELLKWHQTHDNALTLPGNRTLADWIPQDHALSIGAGVGFSINGCGSLMRLDIFIFFSKSNADTGLLIVGDLFLRKNPNPIAFVAVEYDTDKEKFGIMAGVNVTPADFAGGSIPSWLANIAKLSGTIYFGNEPWAFAIGQLADQSTWLQFKVDWNIWLTIKWMVGLGLQIVDGGPKGIGFVFTLSAGANWRIGAFVLWGTFGFLIGTWKTASDSMGAEIWIQLGFKINVFFVFSFGAEIGVKVTYLGKHPWYITIHGEIKIDTPWFLPNVTFTIDKTWQEQLPFDTATITQGLSSSSSAIDPTAQQGVALLAPGLAGALGDESFLYTFNQLNGLNGNRIADPHLRDDIPLVSVDSIIAVNLTQPVSNDSLVAASTYDGTTDTGTQTVQDLSVRYGFASIAVNRAPRFGSTAGIWTPFVTDAETGFSVGGAAPEWLAFAWDADSRADGKLAPKRLLMNSSSPYSFATQSAINDQQAVTNDVDFPCCNQVAERKAYPKPHLLEFSSIPFGARAPRSEQFSNGGEFWIWALAAPPTVAPGDPVYPGAHVARISPRAPALIGYADLVDPAASAQLEVAWDRLPGTLFFEAYDGATLAAQQSADLHSAGSAVLLLQVSAANSRGISRLSVRIQIDADAVFVAPEVVASLATFSSLGAISLFEVSYVSLADTKRFVAGTQRCKNSGLLGPPGSDAHGALAFLPNHDYELVVTSTITIGTKNQGPRALQLSEAVYFRTKGLPGLNACANIGDDIRRHVNSSYPLQRAIPLYRQEPCVLAFENSLSSILPIDRTPQPSDPPEKLQMFPLELNIDRVVSLSGLKRLTVPSDDWILAHRVNPYPSIYITAVPNFAQSKVRLSPSADPLVLRFEAVQAAVGSCGAPQLDHASQVLLHEPIDADGAPGLWEETTGYRATVRQQDGPFTERSGFDIYDLGAFVRQADGSAAATLWSVDGGGNLVAPGAGGGRHYASCGELDWDHLQAQSRINLATAGAAGIAVGVGDGTPVPQAILATVEPDGGGHSLVLRARDANGERELGRAAVTISGPFLLTVTAYDDVVRAAVGAVTVDGARGAIREGRVALAASGPATFAGIEVSALDIYSFDFVTSKYASFGAHLDSYDGSLPTLAAGALGGGSAAISAVLAAHASDIPSLMNAAADPQQRQRLFDTIVSPLGLGLRKYPTAVKILRLVDANGTFGFIIESPEPISLTRDVKIALTEQVRVWVQGLVPIPIPHAPIRIEGVAAATLASLATSPAGESQLAGVQNSDPAALTLALLTFGARQVVLPQSAAVFSPGDQIVRVTAANGVNRIDVYDAPMPSQAPNASGGLRQTMTSIEAARQPAYAPVANLAAGSIAVVKAGGVVGPIQSGHWDNVDVAVPMVALTNGDETKILVLSQGGAPLGPGKYTLDFVLDRDRWPASTSADPEQHYHDERAIALEW